MRGLLGLVVVTIAAHASAQTPTPAPAAADQTIEYKCVAGDTCVKVAVKVFHDAKRIDILHANNNLGPQPHKLKAGQILKLPAPNKGPDARLTFVRNRVETFVPDRKAGAVQDPLKRGDRVNTLAQSSAEVTFRDQTMLELTPETLVVILGDQSGRTAKGSSGSADTTLVNGSLRAFLDDKSPTKTLPIQTAAGRVVMSSGEHKIAVDEKKATRVAVYHGKSSVVAPKGKVDVPEGFGSKAEEGKIPTPPRPLPGQPSFVDPGPFVVLTAAGGDLEAAFVAAASGAAVDVWHIQLARDEKFQDTLVDAEVPSMVTRLVAQKLTPGGYYARVSGIDGDKFEGPYSKPLEISVGFVDVTPVPKTGQEQIRLPDGFECQVDGAAQKGTIETSGYAPHTIDCRRGAGRVGQLALAPMVLGDVNISASLSAGDAVHRTGRLLLRLVGADRTPKANVPTRVKFEAGIIGNTAVDATTDEYGEIAIPVEWSPNQTEIAMTIAIDPAKLEQIVRVALPTPTPPLPPAVPQPPDRGFAVGARATLLLDSRGHAAGGAGLEAGYWREKSGGRIMVSLLAEYAAYAPGGNPLTPCTPSGNFFCNDSDGRPSAFLRHENTFGIALPVAFSVPTRSHVGAYGGMAPGILIDQRSVDAFGTANLSAVRFALTAFLGIEAAVGESRNTRFFFEVAYRYAFAEPNPSDHTLGALMFTLGGRLFLPSRQHNY